MQPYKPLVVGAPRSGFALLASVVIHFVPRCPSKLDQRQKVLNSLMRELGDTTAERIVSVFSAEGIDQDLLYNPNFRYIVGGPKWLSEHREGYAAFRKYIGVRGKGDFTLVTSHPRQVLDMDEIVHSHTAPSLWPDHPGYLDYTRYASCRHPAGILNSSVFSLNALASEYIQKFVPPEDDNDLIRQNLALYKFTDLDFFEGLVRFLKGYLDEFVAASDRYIVMRWEDLIEHPVPTIERLANETGIPLREGFATNLWKKLDHVNLTQAHKHNFRNGKGIVGDWKNWMTNEHLEMMKAHGLETPMEALGYGRIEYLDARHYTDFQQLVAGHLRTGTVFRDFPDPDLFTYAFNKSNLVSDKFAFKRHDWREWTQIERSIFTDEALERRVWDVAEEATGQLNALIEDILSEEWNDLAAIPAQLKMLADSHRTTLARDDPERFQKAFAQTLQLVTTSPNTR